MSDELLVSNFLNRNYKVTLADDIIIIDVIYNSKLDFNLLKVNLRIIFGHLPCLNKVYDDWFANGVKVFAANFSDFLSKCSVQLGQTNWSVNHVVYGKINPNFLANYIVENDEILKHKSALNKLFNQWYDDKVIEASEKMMGYS